MFQLPKFGHHISTCKQAKNCAKCGLAAHGETECSRPAYCVNCNGNHPAFFNTCPTWLQEKEICKVKATTNVSYPEAREVIASRNRIQIPSGGATYAQAAQSKIIMLSKETQTEIINCKCAAAIPTSPTTNSTKNPSVPTTSLSKSPIPEKSSAETQTGSHAAEANTQNKPTKSTPSKHNIPVRPHSLSPRKKDKKGSNSEPSMPENKTAKQKDHQQKGSDPIKTFNRYSSLEEAEMADPPVLKPRDGPQKHGKQPFKKIDPPP
jgi:hypothetical protein